MEKKRVILYRLKRRDENKIIFSDLFWDLEMVENCVKYHKGSWYDKELGYIENTVEYAIGKIDIKTEDMIKMEDKIEINRLLKKEKIIKLSKIKKF